MADLAHASFIRVKGRTETAPCLFAPHSYENRMRTDRAMPQLCKSFSLPAPCFGLALAIHCEETASTTSSLARIAQRERLAAYNVWHTQRYIVMRRRKNAFEYTCPWKTCIHFIWLSTSPRLHSFFGVWYLSVSQDRKTYPTSS